MTNLDDPWGAAQPRADAEPPRGAGADERSAAVANRLEQHAASAAPEDRARLADLCASLRDPDDLTWCSLDPASLIRPAAEPGSEGRDRVYVWAEVFRNALIFAPIMVTWIGLGLALRAYRVLLADDPAQAEQSFL
jgi:hypothetical protein